MNASVVAMVCWLGVVGTAEASASTTMPLSTVEDLAALDRQVFLERTAAMFASVDEFAARWNLEPFDALNLAPGDIEIRYWAIGVNHGGYVLQRRAGQWMVLNFDVISGDGYRVRTCDGDLDLLQRLEGLGLWQLQTAPNHQEIFCPTNDVNDCELPMPTLDGYSVVVDTATVFSRNRSYFDAPWFHYAEEGDSDYREVSLVGQLLGKRFGIQLDQRFERDDPPCPRFEPLPPPTN